MRPVPAGGETMTPRTNRIDTETMAECLLEAKRVVREAAGRRLLDNVSLRVNPGDRVAIVGPTGSGKTLLLRALAMLDPLASGEILWRGNRVQGAQIPRFRSRVMYLHQRVSLSEGTVDAILRRPYGLHVHRDKHFSRNGILESLSVVGRGEEFLSKRRRDLSGGEAQITALLRGLQLNPDLLLLDEPSAALDSRATAAVESLVQRWLGGGTDRATLWITHDLDQAERVATQCWSLAAGKLSGGNLE